MKTLTIKDLPVAAELDRKAMAGVQGGQRLLGALPLLPVFGVSKSDFSMNAEQLIGQSQSVVNQNGNNAAFVSDIHSTVKPTQSANNSISF